MARLHAPYWPNKRPFMLHHLRRSGKILLSPDGWKIRILLWSGAIIVGLVASGFAISTEYANDLFQKLIEFSPYTPFIICPLGLVLVSWLTRKFFPGSQGSGIPQSIAALQIPEHASRTVLLSFPHGEPDGDQRRKQ